MTKQLEKSGLPKFQSGATEADWWASEKGRRFLKQGTSPSNKKGSRLVAKLQSARYVRAPLRVPQPDLEKARKIAEQKGIAYQTLLKMIVHEGLQRFSRPLRTPFP